MKFFDTQAIVSTKNVKLTDSMFLNGKFRIQNKEPIKDRSTY